MTESPMDRSERLHRQAEVMRDARLAKRLFPPEHVCPPSETDREVERFMRLYNRHAAGNIAPVPIDLSFQNGKWLLDIHVHIKREVEYDFTAEAYSISAAFANASNIISHQGELRRRAARDAEIYQYDY